MLLLLACVPSGVSPVADRAEGVRAPLTDTCSSLDSLRCPLPWPSSTFTEADATAETGVRVAVDPAALPLEDLPDWLNLADGFSRVTPIMAGFSGEIDPDSVAASVHLYVSFVDGAPDATEIPLWSEVVDNGKTESLIIAYPKVILPANADLVAVVTDEVRYLDGSVPAHEPAQDIALGLVEPQSQGGEALRAYHAPTRALVERAGLDPAHLLRAWDFNTRSADDSARRLVAMEEAMASAQATVTVTSVVPNPSANVAVIVEGTLDNLPDFIDPGTFWVNLDEEGTPVPLGTRSHPFRVVVPAGEGDYRVAMYGHGTGGDFHDGTFDDTIAGGGFAKVGLEFQGWTGDELIDLIISLKAYLDGSTHSTSGLLQSLAAGYAVFHALDGPLGDTLAADTLEGIPNPAAGRRPDMTDPTWVGGSLGGTMGALEVATWPELRMGVLNVPGGAWSHIIPIADLYKQAAQPLMMAWYPSELDARIAIAMGQNAWDDVDGATYEDPDSMVLIQESIGDPVQPNLGTALFTRARGATLVGVPLDDMLLDLPTADELSGQTGITQYRTNATSIYDIHGFAATDYPAGIAAMDQIRVYMESTLGGAPKIVIPPECVANGSCDFGE